MQKKLILSVLVTAGLFLFTSNTVSADDTSDSQTLEISSLTNGNLNTLLDNKNVYIYELPDRGPGIGNATVYGRFADPTYNANYHGGSPSHHKSHAKTNKHKKKH